MCTAITLEKATIDVVISALIAKMGEINTSAILNGEEDEEEYGKYEKALDLFNKAKESLEDDFDSLVADNLSKRGLVKGRDYEIDCAMAFFNERIGGRRSLDDILDEFETTKG